MALVVQLYIYDISKGAARALSSMLIGKQIDGIWHTGLVCFGKEYFFGSGGIESIYPGTTVLGRPDEVITLGETQITEEVFNEYLFEIYPQFSPNKYHLFDHNCNTFSDEASQFLTGRKIPSYIQDLPREVLSTDFGTMLRDIFESAVQNPSADGVIQRFVGNEERNPPEKQAGGGGASGALASAGNAHNASASQRQLNARPRPDGLSVTFQVEVGAAIDRLAMHWPKIGESLEKEENTFFRVTEDSRHSALKHIETLLANSTSRQDSDTTDDAILLLTHLTQRDPCLLVDSEAGVACLQNVLHRCSDSSDDHTAILKLLTNTTSSAASRKLLGNAGSSSTVMAKVLSFCSSQLLNEEHDESRKTAISATHNSTFGNVPGDSALEMSSALLHVITNSTLDDRTAALAKRAVVNLCRQNPEVVELANMMDFKADTS